MRELVSEDGNQIDIGSVVVVQAQVKEHSRQASSASQVDVEVGTDIGGCRIRVSAEQLVGERLSIIVTGQGSTREIAEENGRKLGRPFFILRESSRRP